MTLNSYYIFEMRKIPAFAIFSLLVASASVFAAPAKLDPKTVEVFDHYIQKWEEARIARSPDPGPFLCIDYKYPYYRERVLNGEIVTHHFKEDTDIPRGMIHNWLGAVFVPGAEAVEIARLLQDFDRHKEIYPEATESRTLGRDGEKVRGFLRFRNKKFITVVLNTKHDSYLTRLGDGRYIVKSYSTEIREVKNPGTPQEMELEPGRDRGLLWRMNAYWRLEQGDVGVFVECNVISLTRGIPWIIAWLVKPIVAKFPGEALAKTLEKTRQVAGHLGAPSDSMAVLSGGK